MTGDTTFDTVIYPTPEGDETAYMELEQEGTVTHAVLRKGSGLKRSGKPLVEAGKPVESLGARGKSTRDTGGHRDCCVFFNWRDPEHFYYVHLGAKPDPASGQIMIVDGAARRPLTRNTRPVPWDDQWHTVKLVRDVALGRIAVSFDDLETPLMEAIDKTFTSGRVGIGSFDDMNDFTAVKVLGRKADAGK